MVVAGAGRQVEVGSHPGRGLCMRVVEGRLGSQPLWTATAL